MKKVFAVAIGLVFAIITNGFADDNYKIGVLAKRGAVKAMTQWNATAIYLTNKVPGKTFEIVPLDFDAVNPAIANGDVDFFLVNSSMFVTAKVKYGATAIATMINSRQGQPLKSFGGVILTSAENEAINDIEDVKGKSFMAVKKSSFGGWQMAYKEFIDAGIDPLTEFSSLEFSGTHDNVVLAVQNEAVDCGTVRTDTLERMANEGLIDLDEFKIINKIDTSDFPFLCSTTLYPEWPLAKTKNTDEGVANEVVAVLVQMKSDEPAAQNAKVFGWTKALNYEPVEDLQKTLSVGAYATK